MKIKYLFAGSGTISGVPAACYGGYCIYDVTVPQYRNILEKQEYQPTTFISSSLTISSVSDTSVSNPSKFACFDQFFPGAEIANTLEKTSALSTTDVSITNKNRNYWSCRLYVC